MTTETSPPASSTFAFVPLNLSRPRPLTLNKASFPQKKRILCAAVDADAPAELFSLLWQTSPHGTVFRQFLDTHSTNREGKRVLSSEQLAHRLKGFPPYSPTYFENGDPLDCRSANIKLAANLSESRARRKNDKPGSVVETLPGYGEKILDIGAYPEKYFAGLRLHRQARLSREQVLQVLNECLNQNTGVLRDATAQTVREYVLEEFKVDLHVGQVRSMLHGRSLRVEGFDYAALENLRPSPRDRAIARWKASRAL